MKIRHTLFASALALATLGAGAARATTDITYVVNEPVGAGGITGTIKTDGTLGTLSTADLAAWNLTVSDGSQSFDLTTSNSTGYVTGSDLSATATKLLFNFGDASGGYLFFQSPTSNVDAPYACFISNTSGCFETGAIVLDPTAGTNGPGNPYVIVTASGPQVIGTAVPEPATWAMMLAGFFGVGFMMRGLRRNGLVNSV